MSVMLILKKLWQYRWVLRSWPQTLYFNFHYLPFQQAWHLPVLLYKPKMRTLKGSVIIHGKIKTGMIKLGVNETSIYPNTGVMLELRGTLIFHGTCFIGNHSFISTSKDSVVEFGHNFISTAALKLVGKRHINFQDDVLLGWDCLLMDADLHRLTYADGHLSSGEGEIFIGKNCWFGNKCVVLKNTKLNANTVVASTTVLSKDYTAFPSKSVIGNDKQVKVLKEGVFLDRTRSVDVDKV